MSGVLEKWKEDSPDGGFFAMLAEASSPRIHELQKAFCTANVPLVGAVFPKLIVSSSFKEEGVLLIAFSVMPDHVLTTSLETDHSFDRMIDELSGLVDEEKNGLLMMFFDGSLPDISSRIDECYLRFADRFVYAGANAGSESFQDYLCLFDRLHVRKKSLLALLLPECGSPLIKHGFSLTDHCLPATSTMTNRIESINWRPAFEVYQELALDNYRVSVTVDNFYRFGVKYPFGVVRADGNVLVRVPVMLAGDEALQCIGEVQEFALLTLLQSNKKEMMAATVGLAEEIRESGRTNGLTFYCAGRAQFLGEKAVRNEIKLLEQSAGGICGAVSLGEIGSNRGDGYPALQNMSILFCPCEHDD